VIAINRRYWPQLLFAAIFCVLLIAFISLRFGAVAVSASQLISTLFGTDNTYLSLIIFELRLPRTLLALCVGALLAASGAVSQGLFRNPLADPSLIGIAAGASVGASIVIVLLEPFNWPALGLSLVSTGAFAGGIVAVVVIYRIANSSQGISVAAMLLSGVAISFLAGSISNLLEFVADNEALRRMSLWRMGGFDSASYTHVALAFVVCLCVFSVLSRHCTALNAFLLGESEARHLGFDVKRVKFHLVFIVALAVGVSVALAGMISFVGLVVPHVVRMLFGPNHQHLIPLSAVAGALLLVLSDTFARTVIAPTELPIGILTALIGAPFFVLLLSQRKRYGMQ